MSDDNHTLPYPGADSQHPTLVIPRDEGTDAAPKRRRKRWPWVVLVLLVVLALLIVAAELVARSILPGIVRSIVIEQLDLPADQQLDVEAGGILLPQLIGGHLDSLHLSTDAVTLEGVTGAVDVTATGVPLRGGDLKDAEGTIRIDESQFTDLLSRTDLPIDEVAFDAPDATVSGSVNVLGMDVAISLTLTPGVVDGDLELTPVGLAAGGVEIDAAQLESFGGLGARLTEPRRVCIADRLPAGITLTDLDIVGSEAVIDVDVDGAIGSDAALLETGVCP